MARVVLDPGHGGDRTIAGDSSWNNAVGPAGTLEKHLALDLGQRCGDLLQAAGHDVRLTRAADVNLRLRERAAAAKGFRADAFVSIHLNASSGHNAQGTETLVHTHHSPRSAALSLAVQDAVLGATGLTDRNRAYSPSRIKPMSLGVLRPDRHDPATAGCLVEVSFLDRADEERRLQDPTYRDRIARALADGIAAFVGPAVSSVPQDRVEAGDAIELAALEAPGQPTVEALLGLDDVQGAIGALTEPEAADVEEAPGIPAGTFSRAFVENTGPPLALIANEAQWPHLSDFVQFIDGLRLRHFTADEFLFMGKAHQSGRCRGLNTYPPPHLWRNIIHTALMVDAIRAELGAPIRITSCYRSPAYNRCVGGAADSRHLHFDAIDFVCRTGTPEIWRRVAAHLRDSDPRFVGGIGASAAGVVHIDTRGRPADW
ncbi:N-acetylmuramoyl-L-alanine amidase [Desulfatitalea alkaliphila]|uniref:N-acetylmuramoyl-L-alanine amidase n=1 Tax=Desulfatitalea alkaliphila TaxID=2929485 RepID=A0AA41R3E0_9BACT|nr:N-acetylmuramoyl-L-alanine amidase [Desulfatitalea alkaliphila]MCJ8502219.1 N-acetylmuramoyl-L-alanine amidase [Desulfatitalea alkaliphila]